MVISTSTAQGATQLCGATDSIVLTDTPWIVDNLFYNAAQSKGTQCTNYDSITTGTDGNKNIIWSSVTNIEYVESTYVSPLLASLAQLSMTHEPPNTCSSSAY
jgi:hypothetical protein